MNPQLVFVHGRSQEHRDAVSLKQEWISAFRKGLAKSRRQIPIPEKDIRFPYYGQTLFDLVSDVPADQVAEVVVRGAVADAQQRAFMQAVLDEVREKAGIDDAKVQHVIGSSVMQRSLQNKKWVLGILRAIDTYVPSASGAAIATATYDVYQYLRNPGIRDAIDSGVRQVLDSELPKVVVAHSLGTIVAYNLFRRDGEKSGWNVSLFMTLGSPLGISVIKQSLAPIQRPQFVGKWVNALDPADVVALFPLDKMHFTVRPPIENLKHVRNRTENRQASSDISTTRRSPIGSTMRWYVASKHLVRRSCRVNGAMTR